MFTVFVRTWWKKNPEWPGGREPDSYGTRTIIAHRVKTEEEARTIARQYNATHAPGPLSRKAEFEET
jgi:hypothetical protein